MYDRYTRGVRRIEQRWWKRRWKNEERRHVGRRNTRVGERRRFGGLALYSDPKSDESVREKEGGRERDEKTIAPGQASAART